MNCPETPGETRDGFYGGRFELLQPEGRGFRAGLDALLLAASIPVAMRGRAADLGAGAGAASLATAVRCPTLDLVLVERDATMAGLARRSIALPANASLASRLHVIEADATAKRAEREEAGLADASFDLVLTNPPFHPPGGRVSPDVGRAAARSVPEPGFLARWTSVAAALLRQNGLVAMIARPDSLGEILGGAGGRLGDLRVLPVHTRASEPATRLLVHARRGSRAPLRILPGLVLHDAANARTSIERGIGDGLVAIDLGLAAPSR